MIRPLLFCIAVAALAISNLGCAPVSTYTRARQVISPIAAVATTAIKSLELWDLPHERALTAQEVPAYRAKRADAVVAIDSLRGAVDTAAAAVGVAEAWQKAIDPMGLVAPVLAALRGLARAAAVLGWQVPGLAPVLAVVGGG